MKHEFTTEDLVQGVTSFVLTLRHTAGCTKQEVKDALHPKMIDLIFKIDDGRTNPTSTKTDVEINL